MHFGSRLRPKTEPGGPERYLKASWRFQLRPDFIWARGEPRVADSWPKMEILNAQVGISMSEKTDLCLNERYLCLRDVSLSERNICLRAKSQSEQDIYVYDI